MSIVEYYAPTKIVCKKEVILELGNYAKEHPGSVREYLRSEKRGNEITNKTLPIIAIPVS